MPILIRRISKGKWQDYCKLASDNVGLFRRLIRLPRFNAPADAITNCLKTTNNQLSMWLLPDEKMLNEVLLALCTGTRSNGLGTIDYIRINTEELDEIGLTYKQSSEDADTAIPELKELHYNVSGFNYQTLGHFQDIVVRCVRGGKTDRKREPFFKPLVAKAIREGRFDFSSLSDEYMKYLKRAFPNEGSIPDVENDPLKCPHCGELIA